MYPSDSQQEDLELHDSPIGVFSKYSQLPCHGFLIKSWHLLLHDSAILYDCLK